MIDLQRIAIVEPHDGEVAAITTEGGEVEIVLLQTTLFLARDDELFDRATSDIMLRLRGATTVQTTGTWHDEYILGIEIDGRPLSQYGGAITRSVAATAMAIECFDGVIRISGRFTVELVEVIRHEVEERGVDPFC